MSIEGDQKGIVGRRLREERMRVGLSQAELAAVGGLQQRAQLNYESGARSPDAVYLLALASVGVDVVYVLTGDRPPGPSEEGEAVAISADEHEVLRKLRQLSDETIGEIEPVLLDADEREILRKFRLLNEAGKGAVEAAMNGYILAGTFTLSGKPDKRVPRLAANRAAALTDETFERVQRAKEDQRRREEERAAKRAHQEKS